MTPDTLALISESIHEDRDLIKGSPLKSTIICTITLLTSQTYFTEKLLIRQGSIHNTAFIALTQRIILQLQNLQKPTK